MVSKSCANYSIEFCSRSSAPQEGRSQTSRGLAVGHRRILQEKQHAVQSERLNGKLAALSPIYVDCLCLHLTFLVLRIELKLISFE